MLKTLSEKAITFAEAKSILEQKEKALHDENLELGHEQKITLEYFRNISVLDKKTSDETAKELIESVPELKEHQIMMLVNLLPDCVDDVDVIFAKERMKLDKTQTEKVVEIMKKVKSTMPVRKVKKVEIKKEKAKSEKEMADKPISEDSDETTKADDIKK